MALRSTVRCIDRLVLTRSGWQSRTLVDQSKAKRSVVNTTIQKLSGIPVNVTFITPEKETIKVKGYEGDSILDIVRNNNLDIDGYGACDGGISCSTCHVILTAEDYQKLGEHIGEEEMDMLDMAGNRSKTSRLGCQLIVSKKVDEIVLRLPELVRDARGGD